MNLKHLRYLVFISLLVSSYFVFNVAWIEINNPGSGEDSFYGVTAYWLMGLTLALSIPLWIEKIKSMRKFFIDLDKIYGDKPQIKEKMINDTIKSIIIGHKNEIFMVIIFTFILYIFVTNFILTPELKQQYLNNLTMLQAGYNQSMLGNETVNISFGGK